MRQDDRSQALYAADCTDNPSFVPYANSEVREQLGSDPEGSRTLTLSSNQGT